MNKMTNADAIRKMTDEELCDYLYAVFLTGNYVMHTNLNLNDEPLLIEWLKQEKE